MRKHRSYWGLFSQPKKKSYTVALKILIISISRCKNKSEIRNVLGKKRKKVINQKYNT
jgi:hypothetical protein